MAQPASFKICRNCDPNGERPKPASAFYQDVRYKDGLSSFCKDCMRARARAYGKAHRARRNAYQNEWRKQNPEKAKAQKQRQHNRAKRLRHQDKEHS